MRPGSLLLALQTAFGATGPDPAPTVTVPRVEGVEVVLDGVLDEPAWAAAAVLTGFSQYEPVDGRPAVERTEVLVWYAPDAIHFGIRAFDSEPGAIRATVADRDNIDDDDHVVLYLDTFDDRRRAFFFAVNPLGVQQDGVRTEGGGGAGRTFGGNIDTSPDYFYQSRGRVTDDGYVVEVRIPFKSLRYPGDGPQRWGLQVVRKVQRTGYTDTWTAARRASASFLGQAGTLVGLQDLERGVVLEAQPFVTATADGERSATNGSFERDGLDPEVGINFRAGFSHLSLDATVNPDFSQVESDVGQVTVNERFALFFPEKRPFFLEGIELFAAPNQLVYTRRIVNPLAGAKVTGKLGDFGVAHLTAVDQAGDEDALFNVARVRRDFGGASVAGLLYTDRSSLDRHAYNRVAAADVRHVFGGLYFVQAQLGGSWTRDTDGVRSAPVAQLELDRTGRRWGFNYEIAGFGEGFETRAGFVPRTGIVTGHLFNRISFYGAPGALAENLRTFFGPTRVWESGDFSPGQAIEGNDNVDVTLLLRGGWEIELEGGRAFWVLDPQEFAGYATPSPGGALPYAPLDEISGPHIQLTARTPAFRLLDASASVARRRTPIFAEGSDGRATTASGSLSLRPHESVRLSGSATWERIDRRRDGSRFARTVIPRLRLDIQPSRAFFLRAIAEYRVERRDRLLNARTGDPLRVDGEEILALDTDDLRVDLLASYEPTPGTVAFLGYGTSLRGEDAGAFRELERVSDGFFLKLAYQFRR